MGHLRRVKQAAGYDRAAVKIGILLFVRENL